MVVCGRAVCEWGGASGAGSLTFGPLDAGVLVVGQKEAIFTATLVTSHHVHTHLLTATVTLRTLVYIWKERERERE